VLACDVDSTVWDLPAWVCEAVLEAYGESAAIEIYTRTLSPHRIHERELYPGATEALRRLQEEHDIRYHSQFTHMRGLRFRVLLAGGVQDMRFELAGCHEA
jgi:hypothetical protein